MNEDEEGIEWASQPSTSAEEDPLALSLPSQTISQFICTSPSNVIPAISASDVSRNVGSQELFFGDVDIDLDRDQIIVEDEEYLFDLPKEGSTSSVQLADALLDRIAADDREPRPGPDLTPLRPLCVAPSPSYTGVVPSEEGISGVRKSETPLQITNQTPFRSEEGREWDCELLVWVEAASKRKASDYVYQSDSRSLFTRPFVTVPFVVQCSSPPPAGSVLRVYARYSRGEHAALPVRRCPHHLSEDESVLREHFVVSESQSATHVGAGDVNDRCYVCLPVPGDSEPFFVPLQFTCFSSCNGGINRRPLSICFVLDMGGETIAQSELSLKVCACPSRDAALEGFEPQPKRRRTMVTTPVAKVVTKEHSVDSNRKRFKEDEDTVYEVQVRGRHLYKLVCSIIANYELSRRYLKERGEGLDTLKSPPSTPLSHRTAIPKWLASLNLSKYEKLFSTNSLFVIDDLEGVINKKYLHDLGVTEEDCAKILESYLSWFDVYNAQRQSSLSSLSQGSSIRIQHTRVRSSTLRYSP